MMGIKIDCSSFLQQELNIYIIRKNPKHYNQNHEMNMNFWEGKIHRDTFLIIKV